MTLWHQVSSAHAYTLCVPLARLQDKTADDGTGSSVRIAFGKHVSTMLCILSEKSRVTSSTLILNASGIFINTFMTSFANVHLLAFIVLCYPHAFASDPKN